MTSRRRAKLVLLVLAVALVGLGVWAWEPLWWCVMTERELFTDDDEGPGFILHDLHLMFDLHDGEQTIRGWYRVHRWAGEKYGSSCLWYSPSGFKAAEGVVSGNRTPSQATTWDPRGSISVQFTVGGEMDVFDMNESPPWLWGAIDQTAPTMPAWMKDDVQWQAALDAQGK